MTAGYDSRNGYYGGGHQRSTTIDTEDPAIDEDEYEYPQSKLIPLMISQLKAYGYYSAAKFLADTSSTSYQHEPSSRLAALCQAGEEQLGDVDDDQLFTEPVATLDANAKSEIGQLVYEEGVEYKPQDAPNYSTWYTTVHQGPCRAAAFSPDGNLFATGSADTTLKVLDTQRVMSHHLENIDEKKVIRTLYDHSAPVNELQFHPNGLTLASCSDDTTIKLYDMNRGNMKRGFRFFSDAYPVRSISFHPSGDFLLSGTDHQAVRIFDVHSLKCFIPSNTSDHHSGPINRVAYSPTGAVFGTCSRDGTIKIYDTVSSRCVNTILRAHDGASVSGIQFSRSGDYLLSTGLDSKGRLWDMRSGKVLVTYEGALHRNETAKLCFTSNEAYVLGPDENFGHVVVWDALTGTVLNKYSAHGRTVRTIAASPVNMGFVSGGDDSRAKYWNISEQK